jgi:hypothetical protein
MGWLISNAKIKLEEIIKEQLKISLSFKESGYNNSMKDVLTKLYNVKNVELKSLYVTSRKKLSTIVSSLSISKKKRTRKPSKFQVNPKVAKHCFAISFDRFNNGGYCVNLKDHSRN